MVNVPLLRSRSKLAVGAAGAAIIIAGYSALWLGLATLAEGQVDRLVLGARARGSDVSFARETISGYPLRLEARFTDLAIDGLPHLAAAHLTAPLALAWTRPWSLSFWRFALPDGAVMTGPVGEVTIGRLSGSVGEVFGPGATPGGDLAEMEISQIAIEARARKVTAAAAQIAVQLPPAPPENHEEPLFSTRFAAEQIVLPGPVGPLGSAIAHLGLEGTWHGALPSGRLPQALSAWRDDGGTIELQSIDIAWGPLSLKADGTMALDHGLQPLGAFSARIMGYDAVLDTLETNGAVKHADLSLLRLGLSMMAQRGADGTPQLKTPLTVQDEALYLGPARLLKLDRIEW